MLRPLIHFFRNSQLKALRYLVCFCGVLLLNGCYESDLEDITLPAVKPKLVIVSFISPEKAGLEVYVSKSKPLFGTPSVGRSRPIPDAEVLFWNGAAWLNIPYNSSDSTYQDSTIQIFPGRTYKLKVTAPDGLNAEAVCTVLGKMNTAITARIDSSTTQPENTKPDYVIEGTWKDMPGAGDHYKIAYFQKVSHPDPTKVDSMLIPLGTISDPFARDFQADGRSFRVSSNPIPYYQELHSMDMLRFGIYLLTTDRHYYEYHRTLNRHQYSTGFEEPVTIYSNVQGGLGVFASYREYIYNFKP